MVRDINSKIKMIIKTKIVTKLGLKAHTQLHNSYTIVSDYRYKNLFVT